MFGALKRIPLLFGCVSLIALTLGQDELRCGYRKVINDFSNENGKEALPGQWPWHVTIFVREHYTCGGSIIDATTILTATHCVSFDKRVYPASDVSVHVGRTHLNESSNWTQIHNVQQIIVHPEFTLVMINHDIALIKLSSNITMNKYVQPVCLWTMDSNQELIVGKNGTVVTFGLNELNSKPNQLKQASNGVIDPLTCIKSYRSLFAVNLYSNIFCGVGQNGVSACNGDSGSGLFLEENGRWFVRGLVSFSLPPKKSSLCDPLKPTGYTDVAKYLDWISQYIDQRVLP